MDDLVFIDQQQIVTLLGKCDQPVGKAALGKQTIEYLIALPDKAVLEISRSCDFLLQRREDRQIDRFLMVLAFSDKQPLILAVNRRYGRADYLPCILWGRTAQEAENGLCSVIDRTEPILIGFLTASVGLTLLSVMLPLLGILSAI